MKISSKLPDTSETIFSVMSKLAVKHNALNLSQGFPEFDVDPRLVTLVEKQMRLHHNQYAPMNGVQPLRDIIAAKSRELYQAEVDPDTQITVTAGATEALFAAITALVKQGDEVILIEPAYDSYEPAIRLSGGIPVFVQLKVPGYTIDWNEVKNAISSKTKLIILNSPHNPTGSVFGPSDIEALSDLAASHDFFIIGDEVYEHIIFDGLRHESLLRYPQLSERSFVISSFGKTFHATGWKTGYCIAPAQMTKEFQKIHQYLIFAINTPVQFAYAEFLDEKESYLQLPDFYQKKRDLFLDAIKDSRFKILPCKGTYFQMLDYSEISDQSDTEFAEWLTREKGIASIPPSVFYHHRDDNKVLRFCFAKIEGTLLKAGEILRSV
jgi:methionine transaminase